MTCCDYRFAQRQRPAIFLRFDALTFLQVLRIIALRAAVDIFAMPRFLPPERRALRERRAMCFSFDAAGCRVGWCFSFCDRELAVNGES